MTLHAYLNEDRARLLAEETDHLLLTSRGTPERGEGVHYLVETLRPLVPTKRLTPTVIRQSVIAGRLKAGQGLRQVQAFAGHKKISATERYRENNLEALRLAVERFHPLSATESLTKSLLL
jgi:integrase/recombinase XerD